MKSFKYCFVNNNKEYPATLKLNNIKKNIILKNGSNRSIIQTIKVQHGKVDCICYIIDKKLAYISDVSNIRNKDLKYFRNLKYLIIDCLWFRYHPSHLNLENSLKLIEKLKPKKAILTNLHSDLDYDYLKNYLPKNISPAYDGLTIKL